VFIRPPNTPGPFGRDFEAYYAGGATWNAGGDPWSRDVWNVEKAIPGIDASRDELLPFVGPAAALPVWSLFARMPFEIARNVWLVGLALALAVLVIAALAIAGTPITWLEAALALLFGGVTGPVISDVALGQAALVSAAAVALALIALDRRSPLAIVAACVAAIQPNLALSLAVRFTARRDAIVLVLAAAAFLAIAFAAGGGPAGFIAYLHRLAAHGAGERFILIQYSVPAILATFGVAPGAAIVAGDITEGIAVITAAIAAYRFRAQPALSASIVVALLPWIVPFFHEHDFAIALLPAIVVSAAHDARARVLGGVACAFVFVDWLGIAQRPYAALQIAWLAFAVTLAYLALSNRRGVHTSPVAPLVTCALLVACVVPFALAHPAPTWPDQLGAFHASPTLDASGVWAAEQRANGLEARIPAWGLLRLIPLIGSALLAASCVLAARGAAVQLAAGSAIVIRPLRVTSGTAVSDSPSHGPSKQ